MSHFPAEGVPAGTTTSASPCHALADDFAREAVEAVQQATGASATPGVKAHLAGAGEAAPLQVKQSKEGHQERMLIASAAPLEVAAVPGQCSEKQRRQAKAAALPASPLQKGSPVAATNGTGPPAANGVGLAGAVDMAPGVVTPPFVRARRAAPAPPQRKKVNFVLSRNSHHLIGKRSQPFEVPVTSPDAQPKVGHACSTLAVYLFELYPLHLPNQPKRVSQVLHSGYKLTKSQLLQKSALKPGTVEAMQKMLAQQQAAAKSAKKRTGNKRRRHTGAA